MNDLERLARELYSLNKNLIPRNDKDWHLVENVLCDYRILARYVQRLLLEARIEECKDCEIWWENDYGWKARNHIEKLESQLKELEG